MQTDAMERLKFLLGDWMLQYRIPKSSLHEAGTDSGRGSFRRALKGKYLFFDYVTGGGSGAHGIFRWDEKVRAYRYWWFEDSGSFATASCNFVDENTLAMNWHGTLLVQTFSREGPDRVILRMQNPVAEGVYELVMEVLFTRAEGGADGRQAGEEVRS